MRSTDDRRSARRFGLGALAVLALAGAWLWLRRHHPFWGLGAAGAGFAVGVGGLVAPAPVLALRRAWMTLARGIGRINAIVLLTVVFFVVFTPIGAVRRLWGRQRKSGWEPHEPRARDHFEHPY